MNARGGRNGRSSPPSGFDEYVFPMSFAQQRLWFLDAVAPGNPFYNIPLRIPMAGRIDPGAVERALNAIIGRHEALRTTFEVIDSEPSQVVRSPRTIALAHRRVDHLPPGDVADAVESLATVEARTPFDLRTGPLIRATLVTRSANDHELLLTIHHIVADGWSVGILCRELSELYVAEVSGRPAQLPELTVQYADFTMWQREQLHGDRLDDLLRYWRTQLDGLPVLEMPTDRPRPRVLDYTGAYIPVELSADLAAQVRALAQREGATLFMALMAAFASLLGRYTAQDDIVVGTPIANRNIADTEQIIGFFVNSLVVRCDLRDEPTFREVLQRVRRTCLDAYAHQDLPFERLVEDLKPERDLARNPLFQTTFQLVNTPSAGDGGTGVPPTVQRGSAIFDLAFTIVDSAGPLRGMIEFSTQLFDNATIARLAAHYRLLLGAVVADPDVRLADIGFLTRPERDLLVAQRIPSPPRVDAITDAVSASVRSTPEAIAVVADDGRLDFRQLDARAGAVAHRLRELGVRSGDLVALLADGTSWLPAAMLGVHRLGAAYLPLDPLQPSERLEFMLADAAPRAIIVGAIDVLPIAGPPVVRLAELDELVGVGGAPDVPSGSGAASPAYVLYTSGSSGVPKGVVIPRSALENHMAWMLSEFEFGPHDRVLQRTTPIFDASVWEFWAPMMAGAQLVLLGTAAKRDPAEIAAAVRHHRITVLQVVPGLLQALLDEPDFLAADALRIVFSGGEALPDALRDHFGAMFDVPLVNLYGPTEATIDATFHRCRPGSGRSVSIGRPIAGTGAVVLDRSARPTPIGVPGRLHLSGQGLALGYLGQPRLTAERFVPDEFGVVPGARLYDTGDLARFRTDGDLEYLGRNDLQVKVRGFRIELAEVERAVEACSGVRRAAAAVHDDQIVAYVAPEPAAGSASDDVDEAEQEVLDRWEDIYEQIYGPLSETPTSDEADRLDRDDPDDLDAIGWVSSFTGRCIDRGAMAAWRDQTVERILALQPHRVLEIGCGTGMILSRIAPDSDRYVGIDLSAPALRYVDEHVVRGSMPSVELLQRPAHALDDLCGEDFDVVVLNSVVQYFPSARYLEQVLDDALRCVRPGGALFVGDVRSLPLLPAFHAAVEAARSDGSEPVGELRRRIDDAVSKEEELVLSPDFFIDVAERHGPARCEVLVKRNGHVTEMSAFRFDAVIRLGPRPGGPPTVIGLDWRRHQLDADRLAASVVDAAADVVIVSGIPDRMVNAPVETFTAGHVPARGVGDAPDDVALSDIARQAGRELTLRPSIGDVPGRLDALFCRPGVEPPGLRAEDGDPSAPRSNEPERGSLAATLIPRIRSELEQRLPEYMTPARFVVMPELPTLPSGKIDRTALPTPSLHRSVRVTPFVEPSDRLEELLVEVWRAVTGVDAVGTHDDFFGELGGHSLLAARLAARLRSVLDTDVPLQLVFDAPTVVAMASALRGSSRLAVDIDGEAEIATTGGDREREVEHVRG